jgi:hypothetical protein
VKNQRINYGWIIKPDNVTTVNSLYVYSSDNPWYPEYYPKIVVDFSSPPNIPAIIAPNGGEIIDSNYNITWSAAIDPDTVQSSLKYQIQLATDGINFTDIVALTNAGVTTYLFDFSGKAETTTAKIRIRTFDGGQYSAAWDTSDNYFTIRHNHAPNAPTSPNPGNVSSATPTLVIPTPILNWNFSDIDSGDTQSAYDVTIYNGTTSMYDSGWINGSSSSYTVPSAANLVRGTVYNWKVKTKDSKSAVSPQTSAMYIIVNNLPVTTVTSYSDGQTVPDNILTFNWTYSDANSQTQGKYQIQGSQNAFSTISYDSLAINGTSLSFTTPPLGSGIWSFRIRTFDGMEWSNWSNRNNLTLPNLFEPNDDTAHAFPILYNNIYSTLIGSLSDVDYFKYTSAANGINRIALTPSTGKNYDVYIYDSIGNLVASGVRGAGLAENIIYEVTNGTTYYVKVVGVGGDFSATLPYSLTLSTLTSNYQTIYQFDFNGNITGKTITRIN